jgi:glycosyltransferase involved in cell wall biosynthesis
MENDMNRLDDQSPIIASVIIPVYNGMTSIVQCLDALTHQTLPPKYYEIIVVDDGSTDASAATINAWCQANGTAPCKLIRQTNQGPAAARNRGAEVAQGELLLFTDADCRPLPNWIEVFVAAFDLLPNDINKDIKSGINVRAVHGPNQKATVTNQVTNQPIIAAMGTYRCEQISTAAQFAQLEFEERYARMQHQPALDVVATYSAAFRRTVFREVKGFDPSFPKANNEDVEFSYRLSELGHHMIFVPDAIVYHPHEATWWEYAQTKLGRAYWRTIVYKRYPSKALKDSYTPQILKVQILLAPFCLLGLCWFLLTRQSLGLLALVPFLLTTLPMGRFALQQRKPWLALWTPWGLWLRSIVFAIGVAMAMVQGNRIEQRTESVLR